MAQASVTRFAAATASALYGASPPYLVIDGVPVLVPRGEAPGDVVREFLVNLTRRAASAASALACGSILAGATSETDEYGDIAFWLGEGDFGPGREREVLDALGLKSCTTPESKVREHLSMGSVNRNAMTWRRRYTCPFIRRFST